MIWSDKGSILGRTWSGPTSSQISATNGPAHKSVQSGPEMIQHNSQLNSDQKWSGPTMGQIRAGDGPAHPVSGIRAGNVPDQLLSNLGPEVVWPNKWSTQGWKCPNLTYRRIWAGNGPARLVYHFRIETSLNSLLTCIRFLSLRLWLPLRPN